MSSKYQPINWTPIAQTSLTAVLTIAATGVAVHYCHASCAEKWSTLGVAGAFGSLLGSFQAYGGSLGNPLHCLKKFLPNKSE